VQLSRVQYELSDEWVLMSRPGYGLLGPAADSPLTQRPSASA
jgi:outer membrane scaffolding protein for murein synthesis (MipA/OmpV family)